jgi:hypothetical protein
MAYISDRVADPDPHGSFLFWYLSKFALEKKWIWIAFKSKIKSYICLKWSPGGPWTLIMAWKMKMEPWRGWRPVVAHSHYFDEEHDPDPH